MFKRKIRSARSQAEVSKPLIFHSGSMQIVLITSVCNKFLGSLFVNEKSIIFYVTSLGVLLASLYFESLEEMLVDGFILVAITLVFCAVYSSIAKTSLEIWGIRTSLAYVCSILSVTTVFIPIVGFGLTQAISPTWITPLKSLVLSLHILGGMISLYAGWNARSEWSDYHDKNEEESRPKDYGLPIS
jgi:hypothetical protein